MTTAEKLRQEGREQAAREILLRQLRRRFPHELRPAVEDRIAQAELRDLEEWLEKFATATSVEEVFANAK